MWKGKAGEGNCEEPQGREYAFAGKRPPRGEVEIHGLPSGFRRNALRHMGPIVQAQKAAITQNTIDLELGEGHEVNELLFVLLSDITACCACVLRLRDCWPSRNGLEAVRLLRNRFEPRLSFTKRAQVKCIMMDPPATNIGEVDAKLLQLEAHIERYEVMAGRSSCIKIQR